MSRRLGVDGDRGVDLERGGRHARDEDPVRPTAAAQPRPTARCASARSVCQSVKPRPVDRDRELESATASTSRRIWPSSRPASSPPSVDLDDGSSRPRSVHAARRPLERAGQVTASLQRPSWKSRRRCRPGSCCRPPRARPGGFGDLVRDVDRLGPPPEQVEDRREVRSRAEVLIELAELGRDRPARWSSSSADRIVAPAKVTPVRERVGLRVAGARSGRPGPSDRLLAVALGFGECALEHLTWASEARTSALDSVRGA